MVLLCFGLVYVFWGSTYLGIRVAVENIPPALMCATRFLISGSLVLIYCAVTGKRMVFPLRSMAIFAMVGGFLLVGGNLTLSWGETYVPSGLASLLVAAAPLWFLTLDNLILGEHKLSGRGKIGLALGLVGVVVLLWPELMQIRTLGRMQFVACIAILFGSASWAAGSVLSKRFKTEADPFTATGWQMLFAGILNLLIAIPLGDFQRAVWTPRGWGAILYLVTFGSLVGYTAYIWLLKHVPVSKVTTYCYVNPVVAVFLGWLILHERIDGYILAGSAIIISAVATVTSAKVETIPPAAADLNDLEPSMAEGAGD